jgi:hypothetical protein
LRGHSTGSNAMIHSERAQCVRLRLWSDDAFGTVQGPILG